MIGALLTEYLEDKKKTLPKLIKHCNDPTCRKEANAEMIPLVVGTHYLMEEDDLPKAIIFIKESIKWKPTTLAAYQLAYTYEKQLRNILKTLGQTERKNKGNEEFKEMAHWYNIAAKDGEGKAMNQLGGFLAEFKDFKSEKTAEEYLLAAKEKKIPQAYNNLIMLYRGTDDYKKLVSILKEKLNQKRDDAKTLMDLMLTVLNKGDYGEYCRLIKEYQGGLQDVRAFLHQEITLSQEEKCFACSKSKPCFKLSCTHCACNDCLFELFAKSQQDVKCPVCNTLIKTSK